MLRNLVRKFAFALVCVPAALLIFGNGAAGAGQPINDVGGLPDPQ